MKVTQVTQVTPVRQVKGSTGKIPRDGAYKHDICCHIANAPERGMLDGSAKAPPLSIFSTCGAFAKNNGICGGCGHEYCDC